MEKKESKFQIIWGLALFFMGFGVFYRIPQVMPKIEEFQNSSFILFFIRLCFYLMGIILIGGGAKKLYNNYKIFYGEKRS